MWEGDMGTLVEGRWTDDDGRQSDASGRYRRAESPRRAWVTANGAPGPSGEGGYVAETGRYHLYVAVGCPWAHRTMIVRKLKKLEGAISLSSVAARRSTEGWAFERDGAHADPLFGHEHLHQVYTRGHPDYTGRVTVPVLWDKATGTIVNNESSEIIRMLNGAFDRWASGPDLYPLAMRADIERWNARIYETVNNGVYRAGFARTQAAYEEAFDALFATLDAIDEQLGRTRYLCGDQMTEADWRLFPTLVRFDVAYVGAFKCNKRRIVDYSNIWPYLRELYQVPGVAETVDLETYKRGYYTLSERNPSGIIPKGPLIDLALPHGRS
jgi:putative glutathione S-transferase